MEGGIDEELDYDVNEEFQDDDDVNTFYRDAEEEEEMKLQEVSPPRRILDRSANAVQEQQKREYRMANANVGDRPQIESDSDNDSLFGDKPTLTSDGKKLKKLMRARGSSPGLFPDSDDVRSGGLVTGSCSDISRTLTRLTTRRQRGRRSVKSRNKRLQRRQPRLRLATL